MTKLNPTTMKTQYDGQYDTFCRKNHDYGNSFEESLDQFGIIASLVRMQDKMLRLQSLTDESKTQQVGSESLLDTLEDLSNYAAMTACWLKGVQAEDDVINKSFHAVKDLIETCDDSDVKHNESYHKLMLNSLYGAHIFKTPGENWQMTQCENGFKPLGAEQAHPNIEDETYDFLEEQVTRAASYMAHIRAHGRTPESKDICDYAYDIARYSLEHYPNPYRILQHMGQTLAMRSLNPNDALLLCGRVTDFIRERTNKEKGLAKTRALLEELGVPKEDIKEIFEGLEDDDE